MRCFYSFFLKVKLYVSWATYGLHGRKIKVQLLKEKEPGNCEGKKCGVISLEEVISLSVTVYFPAILFSL